MVALIKLQFVKTTTKHWMLYPLSLLVHGDIGNAREAHGMIRSARMRMFRPLHSFLDPGEGRIQYSIQSTTTKPWLYIQRP